jgi:nucleoside-diphosphate-sugar epimerase
VRLCVTGASGFIGRELVPLLAAAGHEVVPLGRGGAHPLDLLTDDPAPRLADLRPEGLVHLAWIATPGRFWHAPENLDWLAGSLRLVRAFAAAGGRRLVTAGSCAEYDWGFHRLDERLTPLAPHTLYGSAKAALFRTLEAAAPGLGLSFAHARIFFPFGPFEAPGRLLSSLVDGLAAGRRVAVTAGRQQRDFLHVEDVAAAFALLAASDMEGPVNIASGTTARVRDLVETAARLVGRPDLVDHGARPAQPGEPHRMAAGTARLHGELGFGPRFTLEAGLADAVGRRLAARRIAEPAPSR